MTTTRLPRKPHTVLWMLGALVLLVISVLVLGQIEDAEGDPLIKNPDALLIQIIATAGLVGAGTLPLLIKAQRDAAEAKDQVSNDHIDDDGNPINLRVEQDGRHTEIVELVTAKFEKLMDHVNTQFDGVRSDIRGVRRDVGRNTSGLDTTTRKLEKHLDDSKEVIEEFKTEIQELHRHNASIEDTVPIPPKQED